MLFRSAHAPTGGAVHARLRAGSHATPSPAPQAARVPPQRTIVKRSVPGRRAFARRRRRDDERVRAGLELLVLGDDALEAHLVHTPMPGEDQRRDGHRARAPAITPLPVLPGRRHALPADPASAGRLGEREPHARRRVQPKGERRADRWPPSPPAFLLGADMRQRPALAPRLRRLSQIEDDRCELDYDARADRACGDLRRHDAVGDALESAEAVAVDGVDFKPVRAERARIERRAVGDGPHAGDHDRTRRGAAGVARHDDLLLEVGGEVARRRGDRDRGRRGGEHVCGALVVVREGFVIPRAGHDCVAGHGDRGAEIVPRGAVRGRPLGGLGQRAGPARRGHREHVHRALCCMTVHFVPVRARDDRVAEHGNRAAQLVSRGAIRSRELGCLGLTGPPARRHREHVCSPLIGIGVNRAERRARDDHVAEHGDRSAERFRFAVGSGQLGRLGRSGPPTPGHREHVRRTMTAVMAVSPGDERFTEYGDRGAEFVVFRAVRGGQRGSLMYQTGPARARHREHVRRTLLFTAARFASGRTRDDRVAGDGDRVAEFVFRGAVRGGQLGRLGHRGGPARGGHREHIRRALLGVGAHFVVVRAHHDRVAVHRDRVSEIIGGNAVRGGQLGRLGRVGPTRGGHRVDVSRAFVAVGADRAGDDRVARYRDRVAEQFVDRAGRRGQFRLDKRVDPHRVGRAAIVDTDQHMPAAEL